MAKMELQIPVNPNHVFGVGTLSKYFTDIAILILQERGKLDVKDEGTYVQYTAIGMALSCQQSTIFTGGIQG